MEKGNIFNKERDIAERFIMIILWRPHPTTDRSNGLFAKHGLLQEPN